MDLAYEYLKKEGMVGYLHDMAIAPDMITLAFGREGEIPTYRLFLETDAGRIVRHWEITGDLIILEWNPMMLEWEHEEHRPEYVHVLRTENIYIRRNYPPYPSEEPWK